MKFIHLSDLHIGKRVNEFSMINDQKYILEQILNIIANEEINAVIVSGDVYDKSIPAVEAVTVFDDFLTELATKDITTLIISGNHDSPERLGFGSKIMQNNGVHIYSVFDGELHKVKIDDVNFYMLPFVKPIMVRRFYPEVETYEDAVRAIIENTDIDKSQKNVILSHQFITKTGAETMRSDSESVSVGGLDNIDISVFDDFDYTALGHIHRPQALMKDRIIYAGALEPIDRNDVGPHGYVKGEITEAGVHTQWIPCAMRSYIHLEVPVNTEDTMGSVRKKILEAVKDYGAENMYKIILTGYRDPDLRFDTERMDRDGNLLEVIDETASQYDMEELLQENEGNLLGEYIRRFKDCEKDSIEYQALYEGVEVLLKNKG